MKQSIAKTPTKHILRLVTNKIKSICFGEQLKTEQANIRNARIKTGLIAG